MNTRGDGIKCVFSDWNICVTRCPHLSFRLEVSVVFGMKHLWDIHFLLLSLVYLLGAVTSQVNPGVCHTPLTSRYFRIQQSDHIRELVNPIK